MKATLEPRATQRSAEPAELKSVAAFQEPPDEVEPAAIQRVQAWVRNNVSGVWDATDKRGFRLLQWDPPARVSAARPWELSLEHEARLLAPNPANVGQLLDALLASEDKGADTLLLPGIAQFARLSVHRYVRDPGPQSVDCYFDVQAGKHDRLIPRQITVRQRLLGSQFMTWSASADGSPLNLEMPFVALGTGGMTVRAEFNWMDDWKDTLIESLSDESNDAARRRNPLFIAAALEGIEISALAAVLQHTTFRQKFGLRGPSGQELFVINVDHVTAQHLATGRVGAYVDIDISGMRRIDQVELERLSEFAEAIAQKYELRPNPFTKALRDARVTGMSGRW